MGHYFSRPLNEVREYFWPRKKPSFQRISIIEEDTSGVTNNDLKNVSESLIKALQLRRKYMSSSFQSFPKMISTRLDNYEKNTRFEDPIEDTTSDHEHHEDILEPKRRGIDIRKGVAVLDDFNSENLNLYCPDRDSFLRDQNEIVELINNGRVRSFCRTRLGYMSSKFNMHILLNSSKESEEQKKVPYRDFFNVIKVDTHVHASGCVNQNELLNFIKEKVKAGDYRINYTDSYLEDKFQKITSHSTIDLDKGSHDYNTWRQVKESVRASILVNQKELLKFIENKIPEASKDSGNLCSPSDLFEKITSNATVDLKEVPFKEKTWEEVKTHVQKAVCEKKKEILIYMRETFTANSFNVSFEDQLTQMYADFPVFGEDIFEEQTIKEVFEDLKIDCEKLNLDKLDVHADRDVFDRFDRFNDKYNPVGESKLRNIFFKTDNYINGTYFAELMKKVIKQLEESKCQKAEYRLSIYGRKQDEWQKLAKWIKDNNMNSESVSWIIQVPRLYNVYKKNGDVQNFQEMLKNIFLPLFEATSNPEGLPLHTTNHEDLLDFLQHVSAIDSVDDESKSECTYFSADSKTPDEWQSEENPPYTYYLYYMHANLAVLNDLRSKRGMNAITLRPHCGEAGNYTHLVAGFLLAENIAHGITLNKVPVLEYLYYLTQIGIAMSPMSNNALFLKYQSNPLPEYFSRGLNISLSTDDPMQFHFTKEPLIEEYSIAGQIWNLSSCDLCEIARNSVLQSGFDKQNKKEWLGQDYSKAGVAGNDATKTNVPSIRVAYRYETLMDELACIARYHKKLP